MSGQQPTDNIYLMGLPPGTDTNSLQEFFGRLGNLASCKVLPSKQPGGKCAAFVQYVSVEEAQQVVNAISTNPQELGLDENVKANYADSPSSWGKGGQTGSGGGWDSFYESYGKGKGKSNKGKSNDWGASPYGKGAASWGAGGGGCKASETATSNLYVTKLPPQADENFMKELFGQYGTVVNCKALQPKQPGGPRAGFVRFSSVAEASTIQEQLNGNTPQGLESAIGVTFAVEPGSDNSGGGWGGGGGGGKQIWPELQPKAYAPKTEKWLAEWFGASFGGGGGGAADSIIKHFKQGGYMPGGSSFVNDENALYVEGLPSDWTDTHLYRLFSSFGAIAPDGVRALMNEQGLCKGIGFVNFLMKESADAAIQAYNDATLPTGGVLKVRVKAPKNKGKGKGSDVEGAIQDLAASIESLTGVIEGEN